MGAQFLQAMQAGMTSGIGRERLRAKLRSSYGKGFSNETYRQMGANRELAKTAGAAALALDVGERIGFSAMPQISVTGSESHIHVTGMFNYKATETSPAGSKFLNFNWEGTEAPTREQLEQEARNQHDLGRTAEGTPTQGDFDTIVDVRFTVVTAQD